MNLCELHPEGVLYFDESDTMVLADLHLGWEPSMTDNATLFAEDVIETVVTKFQEVIQKYQPHKVVFAGDVIHQRTSDSKIVRDGFTKVTQTLIDHEIDSVFVSGNHDPASLPNGESLHRFINIENVSVFHGKEPITAVSEQYIFAHLHPVISVRNTTSCFVLGENRQQTISFVILPSFNPYLYGLPTEKINWQYIPLQIEDPEFEVFPASY